MLTVGHDGGDLPAFGRDLILRLGQSARVDPAVRAPMPAMERHRDGSILQQRVETDELAGFVRENEVRHPLARLRRVLADIVLPQAINQTIDRGLELRAELAHGLGEGLQTLGKRRVHVAALDEGLFEELRERFRVHSTVL